MMRCGNLRKIGLIMGAVALAAAVGVGAAGAAQEALETPAGTPGYPAKEVNVIIGARPGEGCDILASALKPYLRQSLGADFISQYLPGSGGGTAWTYLAQNAVADGYTLAMVETPALLTGKELVRGVSYTLDDFVPLANIVADPAVLVVAADSPFQSFQDFISAARKTPGRLKVAHSGAGGDDYFNLVLLQGAAGIRTAGGSFHSDRQAWQALLEKDADACVTNLSLVLAPIRTGQLRALAIFAEKKHPALPKLPTLKELGVNLAGGVYRGYCVPRGTPQEVVTVLVGALERAVRSPEFRRRMEERGYFVDFKEGREYEAWLRAWDERFRQVIRQLRGKGSLP